MVDNMQPDTDNDTFTLSSSTDFNEGQLLNILAIEVTDDVSSNGTDCNEGQLLNIFALPISSNQKKSPSM